jgi:hypothetical protein
MKILFLSLALLLPVSAIADTCKYEDADGRVIYSNMPMKGARKIACFGFDSASAPGGAARNGKAPRTNQQPTPSDFPRVDAGTQKQRDDTRRKILDDELATEQQALEQAKRDYAEGETEPEVFRTANGKTMRNMAKYEEKMKKLQENVELHEKNIQMLQKELAGTK